MNFKQQFLKVKIDFNFFVNQNVTEPNLIILILIVN